EAVDVAPPCVFRIMSVGVVVCVVLDRLFGITSRRTSQDDGETIHRPRRSRGDYTGNLTRIFILEPPRGECADVRRDEGLDRRYGNDDLEGVVLERIGLERRQRSQTECADPGLRDRAGELVADLIDNLL